MITIIDYGMGNLNSISYKLERVGIKSLVTSDPLEIKRATKLILPGVGHFKEGMNKLSALGLDQVIIDLVANEKIPILGICLGMQLLTSHSEEGDCNGLSLVKAVTKKFDSSKGFNLRVPHVGWNKVNIISDNILFKNIEQDHFYFTHSYYVESMDENNIITLTNYGLDFVSTICEKNIVATQFHPEKSHKTGFKIIENFVKNFD